MGLEGMQGRGWCPHLSLVHGHRGASSLPEQPGLVLDSPMAHLCPVTGMSLAFVLWSLVNVYSVFSAVHTRGRCARGGPGGPC